MGAPAGEASAWRRSGTAVAVAGAIWGLGGYLVLWGHTPLVVHRPFVVSAAGTALLLPIRLVLAGIRVVEERVVGHPFDFSASSEWIGVLSGAVGGGLALVAMLAGRFVVRLVRGFRAAG